MRENERAVAMDGPLLGLGQGIPISMPSSLHSPKRASRARYRSDRHPAAACRHDSRRDCAPVRHSLFRSPSRWAASLSASFPGLPSPRLNPDIVFGVFLPPILYHAALFERSHDFRANLRYDQHAGRGTCDLHDGRRRLRDEELVPDLPWAAAFVLGAIVSPPDAVATTAILHRLRLPARLIAVIEGESLVNNAAAIILYKFALAAVLTGTFSLTERPLASSSSSRSAGLRSGWPSAGVSVRVHTLLEEYLASNDAVAGGSLRDATGRRKSSAYPAFSPSLPSGCGARLRARRSFRVETRQRTYTMWDAIDFFLNSLIFTLIGLQLPPIVQHAHRLFTAPAGRLCRCHQPGDDPGALPVGLPNDVSAAHSQLRGCARAIRRRRGGTWSWSPISVCAVSCRWRWPCRCRWAMRDGSPLPERALIVFLTFAVIVTTLVVQGLSLPFVLRLLRLDGGAELT